LSGFLRLAVLKQMKTRILTALVALPILIASFLISWLWPLFVLLALAALGLGLYEFWLLAKKRGVKVDTSVSSLGAIGFFACFFFDGPTKGPDVLLIIIAGFIIAALIAEMLRGLPFDKMIAQAGATVLGTFYLFLLGGHLVAMRVGFEQRPNLSTHLLGFFFLILMGSDAGAYFAGRAFGKRKLAPKISPGKTWEGFVGGMIASLAFAVLTHFWFFRELPLKWALPLAAVMNVLGVAGDLTESALKRGSDAKDTANILPGHGGLLDRIDSLLFNAPLLYYFAKFYFQ
jgi:phosphatidate cytidylyltransferase